MLKITSCLNTLSLDAKIQALLTQYLGMYEYVYQTQDTISGNICFVEYPLLAPIPTQTVCIVIGNDNKEEIYQSTTYHIFGYVRLQHFSQDMQDVVRQLIDEIEKRFMEYRIQSKHIFASVKIHTILYVESFKHTLTIHSKTGIFTQRTSMQQFLMDCKSISLFQIHKSYVVNIFACKQITGDTMELIDGTLLPIGKTFKEKTINMLKKG